MSYLRSIARIQPPARRNPEESVRLSLIYIERAEKDVAHATNDLERDFALLRHRQARRQLAIAIKRIEVQS